MIQGGHGTDDEWKGVTVTKRIKEGSWCPKRYSRGVNAIKKGSNKGHGVQKGIRGGSMRLKRDQRRVMVSKKVFEGVNAIKKGSRKGHGDQKRIRGRVMSF
jgi:hypothetical protein